MTIATVQLIMGGLGIFAGLLIALLGPGRRLIRWPLAIATGAGIAITGWPNLWLVESSPQMQLHQSLLLAAVVVLVSLLTIILLYPSRRALRRNQAERTGVAATGVNLGDASLETGLTTQQPTEITLDSITETQEPGRDAIALQLEQSPDAMIANQEDHAMMHLLASAKKKNSSTGTVDIEEETSNQTDSNDASEPLLIETTSNAPSINQVIEDEINTPAENTDTADVVSLAERRVQREGEVAADALDLSDSEELYQAMRDAEAELELPEDSTWLDDEVETEVEGLPAAQRDELSQQRIMDEEVEDAEILAINEAVDADATTADLPITEGYEINTDAADIDLGADELAASGVPAHEGRSKAAESTNTGAPLAAPAPTLEAALSAQRQSIAQLSSDTDTLTNRLHEWRTLSDSQEQTAWQSSLRQGQTVQHQQQRILAENNFRSAAVDLIRTQRDVMRQLMTQIGTLGEQREEDLASLTALQTTSTNQQRLARQAALLARKAAAEKQTALNTLQHEQTAHARTQSAAKRAMAIARDAVDKLAKHERRLGIPGNRHNPDSQR